MPDTDTDTQDEVVVETIVEIDPDLAARLRDAQQAYDEVREYLEGLKDQVKAHYASTPGKLVGAVDGEPVFTLGTYERTRFNSSKLKREYPDIYAQFATTHESYQRISIKRWAK